MITRRLLRRAVPVVALLVLAGCGGPPPPPPPPLLQLSIAAGAAQNQNPDGASAPVAVRLYQLAASDRFEQADVFALTEHEKATLADQAPTGSQELLLRPGDARKLSIELKPGVQFLGVAVLFRDIDHARWRALAPVAPHGPTALDLRIAGTTATLSPAKAEKTP